MIYLYMNMEKSDEYTVFIGDIDKIQLIQELFNNSKINNIWGDPNSKISYEEAKLYYGVYMDYVKARPMKILIGVDDYMDVYNYNRNNGDRKAEDIVNILRNNNIKT